MRLDRFCALILFLFIASSIATALDKQPAGDYRARRIALGNELHGGIAILFAAEESEVDFDPYRQDSNFYYLTGWSEPGAALLIVGPANEPERSGQPAHVREYKEILFLPTRNLRMEVYTGAKMDAATPGVSKLTGVDEVEPLSSLAGDLNKLIADDRRLAFNVWTQPHMKAAESLLEFTAATLGATAPAPRDVTMLTTPLREVKDAGEIELLKKASLASIAGEGDDAIDQARRNRTRGRRPDDCRLVQGRLRTAILCTHRWHRNRLDHPALLRGLPHHRGWRYCRHRCRMRVFHVRVRHYAHRPGERTFHRAPA